ncbi:MAG: hypothetical protein K2J71_10230 [Oscillospiraceae bacterium]|nr:hypothetical protein [Oscillospiraceae bacterium]
MNQKKIRKLLHHLDEQTAKRIADEYPATDQATKEKIYQQICERRHSMQHQNQKAGKQEMIAETYHTPGARAIPWARTLGMAAACAIFMGGTIGGIWKLTRLQTPSEEAEELKFVAESNTTNPTESTTSSETSITTQALVVIATNADTTMTTTYTTTQTAPVTAITAITTTSTTATTTIPPIHKETVISATEPVMTDADTAPVAVTEPPVTEPDATVPPVETIRTETEPVTTRPAYLTAYLEICENDHREFDSDLVRYGLYDIDKDGTPELIINHLSSWMDMYSYADDQIYTLMDRYPYGAGGNMGYSIYPFDNCITYSFTEFAGLIYYECFLTITPEHTLEETAMLKSYMFHDDNNDGIPQEEEINTDGSYSRYELNHQEITVQAYEQFQNEHAIEEIALDIDKTYDEIVKILKN